MTVRIDENEEEIDFVLIKKEHQRFVQNVKTTPGEFQHTSVMVDIDKKKIRNVVRKTCAEIRLLIDVQIRKRF